MNLLDLQADPKAFRAALLIDTDAGPKPLSDVVDDWQKTDFEALDDAWKRAVVGIGHPAKYQRAYLERPRGHSKTQDIAVMVLWALFASTRQISGLAAAGDLDQARLLRDALGRLTHCNSWLSTIIDINNYKATNVHTGSSISIISSDAPSSFGALCDFIVCDEVTHWKKRDLWDSLFSTAAKRAHALLLVIANAGIEGDWSHELRESIRKDPDWYFHHLDGPVASWISPKLLEEQRRLLPPLAFQRLWLNIASASGGDALSPEVIDAAFNPNLSPLQGVIEGWTFCSGLDLGVSRDASALVTLGVRRGYGGPGGHAAIRLADVKVWRPTKDKRVNLTEVEDEIVRTHLKFNLRSIGYDPWQATHMASRLQSGGLSTLTTPKSSLAARVPMVEVTASGANLQRMASELIQSFNDRRVELYPHEDLRRELKKLRVEEKSYGFRLVSPRDEHGHGDIASAFSIALIAASELAAKPVHRVGAVDPLLGTSGVTQATAFDRHLEALERGGADYSGKEAMRLAIYRASGGARGSINSF